MRVYCTAGLLREEEEEIRGGVKSIKMLRHTSRGSFVDNVDTFKSINGARQQQHGGGEGFPLSFVFYL